MILTKYHKMSKEKLLTEIDRLYLSAQRYLDLHYKTDYERTMSEIYAAEDALKTK